MSENRFTCSILPPKPPLNNQLARDPKSSVLLEVVGPTTSLFVVASVANLFGRVKLGR